MIRLTQQMIDHIFEPRRAFSFAERSDGSPMKNRLLTDGKGKYLTVTKVNGQWEWCFLNRQAPEYGLIDTCRGKWGYRKGTWPAWIPLPNAAISSVPNQLFECLPEPVHQQEILLAFYHLAFPNWDDIVKIDSWPQVSEATWKYIHKRFADFDRRMHPDVLPGGAWGLGCGFSSDRHVTGTVPDWMIDVSPCTVAYKSTPFRFSIWENRYGDNDEYSSFYSDIQWDVVYRSGWMAEEGRLLSDHVDEDHRRVDNLAEAQFLCWKRAGCELVWRSVPPHNEHIAAEWQTDWVRPQIAQRAA